MRTVLMALAAASLLAPIALAQAPSFKELQHTSWGKPGVSLDDYRADAIACATEAVRFNLGQTEVGKRFAIQQKAIDDVYQTAWMSAPTQTSHMHGVFMPTAALVSGHVPGKLVTLGDFADVQYGVLDSCLATRGYRQFELTSQQVKTLGHLKRGSDERRAYLHSLASDPQIMAHQGLTSL